MSKQGMAVAVCGALAAGCAAEPRDPGPVEAREIIANLVQAGFRADDIAVVGGVVYVGRDAAVSLAASRELLEAGGSSQEQYRTTNLIGSSIAKICVDGPAFTGAFGTALDLAIQNYDEQPLRFAMARAPSGGCSFTISAVLEPGIVGGYAGFPAGGLPYSSIHIGTGLAPYGVDVIEHVITHELGHAIGLRHSDYYNRSISCGGLPDNEGDGGIGAIHVPGTPTTATPGGSLMNSCFGGGESGELTGTDVTALLALYGPIPLDFPVAFQANTGALWTVGPGGAGSTGLGTMPGTSPSIAKLAGGGFQVAFHASTGRLWTTGAAGTGDLGVTLAAGTSPSITGLSNGSFQIAFHGSNGRLWYTGSAGPADTGLALATGTSPSITSLTSGGYQIAFQASDGRLWHTGSAGGGDTGYGMAAGSSPSIAGLATGGFQIAFQANTGRLWYTGAAGTADTGYGMAAGTSPSIAALAGSGFQIAFHANGGSLWYTGSAGTVATGLGVASGTSPSIAARSGGGFDVVFQESSGYLWRTGTAAAGDQVYGMAAGTSPAAR